MLSKRPPVVVDPMSVILPPRFYDLWLDFRHPHVPKVAEVRALLERLSNADRRAVLARAKQLRKYAAVIEDAGAAKSVSRASNGRTLQAKLVDRKAPAKRKRVTPAL